MNPKRATELLLSGGKLTNRVRKHAMRCRETKMESATPIYAEKVKGEPTEYFSSKASEVTPEQRLAARLRRASLVQIDKWHRRNIVCRDACLGIVDRIPKDAPTSALRRREHFDNLADKHHDFSVACAVEIARRNTKAASRGN